MRRRISAAKRGTIAVGLAVLGIVACGGPWVNLREGDAGALRGVSAITVKGFTYEGLTVGRKSEGEYLADTRDSLTEEWETAKHAWSEAVGQELGKELAGEVEVTLVPFDETETEGIILAGNIVHIDPGFRAVTSQRPSTTQVHITIYAAGTPDRPIYSFDLTHRTKPTSGRFRLARDRILNDLEWIGRQTARFVRKKRKG